jgi:hypothetical protein
MSQIGTYTIMVSGWLLVRDRHKQWCILMGLPFFFSSVFFLVQKLKIGPKGFPLGVKAEIEKIFSICPKLLT